MSGATLLFALSSFAYPPVFAAAVFALVLALGVFWLMHEPEQRLRALTVVFISGAAASLVGLAGVLHYGGITELQRLIHASEELGIQGGGLTKLGDLVSEFADRLDYFLALLVALVVLLYAVRLAPVDRAKTAAALFGPAFFMLDFIEENWREPETTAPFILAGLGLLAPVCLLLVRRTLLRSEFMTLLVITLSSLVTTLVVLWATANGLRNVALGMMPACGVAIGCLSRLRSAARTEGRRSGDLVVYTTLVTSLLLFLILQNWTHVYRDHSIFEMDATISSGAWMGIRTTQQRKHFVEQIDRDIEDQRAGAKTILFTDSFPGGYLMSDLRPRTPAIWLFPWGNSASTIERRPRCGRSGSQKDNVSRRARENLSHSESS